MRLTIVRIIYFSFLCLLFTACRCSGQKPSTGSVDNSDKVTFDVNKFDSDPEVRRIVFDMRFSEIARRFGDVIFEQNYTLEITSYKQKLEFSNRDLIEQAKNGDYHIKVENSSDKVMEVYYIARKLYVSMDGKKFFPHTDDLIEARAKIEGVYSQANTFLKTYSHLIKFISEGEEERDGVRFLRFKTEINNKPEKSEAMKYFSLDEISGYLLIDRRSGGVVLVDIKGVIKYEKESRKALSRFSIKSAMKKSTGIFSFKVPEVGTEPQKLRIEKDLLERLEKMEENFGAKKEEDQEESNR